MSKIRVLYVEDDPEWREGISHFFQAHERIDLYACAASIEACFSVLQDQHADVVVMDILLDDTELTGVDATLDITTQYPDVKVIMLSTLDDNDEIFNEAFMNGAYDYLYKYDFEKLPETIYEAMSNPTSKYGSRLRKLVYEKKRSLLNKGDRELLSLMVEGKTQLQIAEQLQVSLAAVKKHVGRILKKFNWSRSSRELADKCDKWGLLNEDEG